MVASAREETPVCVPVIGGRWSPPGTSTPWQSVRPVSDRGAALTERQPKGSGATTTPRSARLVAGLAATGRCAAMDTACGLERV
jgi:hypothetical protein